MTEDRKIMVQPEPPVAAAPASGLRGGEAEPSAPEWAAAKAGWNRSRYELVGPISKQTPQRIYHPAPYNSLRESFTDLGDVMVRGPVEVCRRAVDQLNSSRALADQDKAAANVRHDTRVARIIADASGNASAPSLAASRGSTTPTHPQAEQEKDV